MTIVPLHAGNPGPMTGSGNWTYLIPGPEPILIDAGVGAPDHLAALAAEAPNGPAHVLVTHAHGDHASGAAALAARWPAARFAKAPWPGRDDGFGVGWAPLADGARIPAGDGDALEVVHTPGHAPDHVVLWHAGSGTVFGGDLLVQGSTVVIPASDGGSLADYLRSLARVLALSPRRVLPAHGPVIEEPAALIHQYLAHRAERERQVLDALAAGLATPAAIAGRIYVALAPALVPMAEESVLAHLQKLEAEGRAQRRAGRWRARR